MIELSNHFFTVFEYEGILNITLNRYYDTFNDVGVFYRILKINSLTNFMNFNLNNINNNLFNKVKNSSGHIMFKNGETQKIITLTVYPDFFLEEKETKFIIEIYNPFGGCYIGKISRAIIEIYDEIIFADLKSMRYSINGNVDIDIANSKIILYLIFFIFQNFIYNFKII